MQAVNTTLVFAQNTRQPSQISQRLGVSAPMAELNDAAVIDCCQFLPTAIDETKAILQRAGAADVVCTNEGIRALFSKKVDFWEVNNQLVQINGLAYKGGFLIHANDTTQFLTVPMAYLMARAATIQAKKVYQSSIGSPSYSNQPANVQAFGGMPRREAASQHTQAVAQPPALTIAQKNPADSSRQTPLIAQCGFKFMGRMNTEQLNKVLTQEVADGFRKLHSTFGDVLQKARFVPTRSEMLDRTKKDLDPNDENKRREARFYESVDDLCKLRFVPHPGYPDDPEKMVFEISMTMKKVHKECCHGIYTFVDGVNEAYGWTKNDSVKFPLQYKEEGFENTEYTFMMSPQEIVALNSKGK
jgi:hypothetical protein